MAKYLFKLDRDLLIRLSEEMNRLLILLNLEGRVIHFNRVVEKTFSWDLYESVGKSYETLCQKSHIRGEPLSPKLPLLSQGSMALEMEISFLKKNTKQFFLCEMTCLEEVPKGIMIIGQEITALKTRHQVLDDIHHYLFSIFQYFPVGFFWKDETSNYLGADPRFLTSIVGLKDLDQLKGLSDFDCPWTKQEALKFRKDDAFVRNSTQPKLNLIEEVSCADQKTHQLLVSKIPLLTEEKEVIGSVGLFTFAREIDSNPSLFF